MIRASSIMVAAAGLALVACINGSASADTAVHELGHWYGVYTIHRTQAVRVCIAAASGLPGEHLFIALKKFHGSAGNASLEQELRVQAGQFQCDDTSYDALEREGFEIDPDTGAVTFLIEVGPSPNSSDGIIANQKQTSCGSNQTSVGGALMVVDAITGAIKLHEPIILGRLSNGPASQPPTE